MNPFIHAKKLAFIPISSNNRESLTKHNGNLKIQKHSLISKDFFVCVQCRRLDINWRQTTMF